MSLADVDTRAVCPADLDTGAVSLAAIVLAKLSKEEDAEVVSASNVFCIRVANQSKPYSSHIQYLSSIAFLSCADVLRHCIA